MPDTAYKANQTQHSTANQTQHSVNSKPNTEQQRETQRNRGFYLEKKKKNRQYTNKNQTLANPRSRRRDATARSSSPLTLAPHRRSEIGLCSGARSEICRRQTVDRSSEICRWLVASLVPPLRLRQSGPPSTPQGFSLSLSLSLYLTEWPNVCFEICL